MEDTEHRPNQNPLQEELAGLRQKQYSGGEWTPENRRRLLELTRQLEKAPAELSVDERKALHRAGTAGVSEKTGGPKNPELTPEERILIISANTTTTQKKE